MAKLTSIAVVVALMAIAVVDSARLDKFKQSRFFARQEAVPAQTPYPPSGIKPDVPFELPNEQQQPEQPEESDEVQLPEQPEQPEQPQEPDNTYLPPDNLLPPSETYGPPDQFNAPPEASGNGPADNAVVDILTESEQPEQDDEQNEQALEVPEAELERLVLARRFRKQSIKPAKLRAAKLQVLPVARPRLQRLVAQPIYSTNGALVAYKVLRPN